MLAPSSFHFSPKSLTLLKVDSQLLVYYSVSYNFGVPMDFFPSEVL